MCTMAKKFHRETKINECQGNGCDCSGGVFAPALPRAQPVATDFYCLRITGCDADYCQR